MNSAGKRLAKIAAIIAPVLLVSSLATPAVARQLAPTAVIGASPSASVTPSPSSGEIGETQKKPNVGDDAPSGFGFEKHENFLKDESGLIALGLAVLIGAGTAFLVLRMRRKSSLY